MKKDWAFLALLVFCYFLLRLPWLFSLPLMEAPDEANHLWVTNFLASHWRAPTLSEITAGGAIAVYGPLSPFGYIPNAIISAPFLQSEYFRLFARLGTLMAGLPTIFIALYIGKILFARNAFTRRMLPLLVVAHPQLVFTQSYTNTDGLVTTLSSLAIFLMVRLISSQASVNQALLIGFITGLSALTKTNSLSLVPALLIGFALACRVQKKSLFDFIRLAIAFGVSFAASCLFWFARNYLEFKGDALGSKTMYNIWEKSLDHVDNKPVLPWPTVNKLAWWRFVFFDFWGLFGFMNRYLWRPFYFAYLALSIIAGVAYTPIGSFICARYNTADGTANHENNGNAKLETAWQFLAISAAFNMLAVFYVTASGLSGPHGRYLFPNELPLFALILGGFSRFDQKKERILAIFLLLLNIACVITGWLTYYRGLSWTQ